jgi:hypothetical protein
MEIIRIQAFDELSAQRLEGIQKLFEDGFKKEIVPRKFSWKNFVSYWESALLFPWNALWLLIDDVDEDAVYGIIGGMCFPNMLTEHVMAFDTCWRTAQEVKGKGFGWELFATFMEWAIKEQGATRIMTHRFISKDLEADDRFDKKIREMGFSPSGCEYYMDI